MNHWQRFLYARSGDLGREVADLLLNDSGAWQTDRGYWLTNEAAKIEVWIANGAYALRLRIWPTKPGFPSEISPNWFARSLIWSLVKRLRVPSPEKIAAAHAAEVLRQRREAA